MNSKSPIKTCVLGVGLAGLVFHVPFILALPEHFTLVAVLEPNPSSDGGKVKERFGVSVKVHRSLEDVIRDSEVELVIVATPNDTHHSFAKAALDAGKHVLVDKPVTTTLQEAQELGALAKAKGLTLYPYQNSRYASDYIALQRLLDLPRSSRQSLGELVELESHFDRYRNVLKGTWKDEPRPGAGLTFDLGPHIIDQTLNLFGRPKSVTAFIENVRGIASPDVDDCFTIILRYIPGSVSQHPFTVILRAHMLSVRTLQPRFIVRGTKGTYVKYGGDTQEGRLRVMPRVECIHESEFGMEPETTWGELHNLKDDDSVTKSIWPCNAPGAYVRLFRNLAATIRGSEEQAIKWEESAEVIEIIELAHRSSKEGRTIELR